MTQTNSSNFNDLICNANFDFLWTCNSLDSDDDDDNDDDDDDDDDNDDDNEGGDDDDDIEQQGLWQPLWQ